MLKMPMNMLRLKNSANRNAASVLDVLRAELNDADDRDEAVVVVGGRPRTTATTGARVGVVGLAHVVGEVADAAGLKNPPWRRRSGR